MTAPLKIKIGILTLSDRASKGVYRDRSGAIIMKLLKRYLISPWEAVYKVIPDEQKRIEKELRRMIDREKCCLVVTTGGTGPAKRDVTPEATEAVSQKILPGFGELMRAVSLKSVPTAILSRQTAGIRERSLIINLPGKPASIQVCLEAIFTTIPACLELIGGPMLQCSPRAIHPVDHKH